MGSCEGGNATSICDGWGISRDGGVQEEEGRKCCVFNSLLLLTLWLPQFVQESHDVSSHVTTLQVGWFGVMISSFPSSHHPIIPLQLTPPIHCVLSCQPILASLLLRHRFSKQCSDPRETKKMQTLDERKRRFGTGRLREEWRSGGVEAVEAVEAGRGRKDQKTNRPKDKQAKRPTDQKLLCNHENIHHS